jgi:hypothetical protein
MEESPAINQGSNPLSLLTDQRGASHLREAGGKADIGAFENQSSTVPVLTGDYNDNQIVDAADYVIWRKTMGAQVDRYEGADGNGSNTIDLGDFTVWRANFGSTSGAVGIPTPALGQAEYGRPSVRGATLLVAGASGEEIRRGSEKPPRTQGLAANDEGNLVKLELLPAIAASEPLGALIFELSQPAVSNGDLTGESHGDEPSVFDSNERLLDAVWAEWRPAVERH